MSLKAKNADSTVYQKETIEKYYKIPDYSIFHEKPQHLTLIYLLLKVYVS